MFAGSILVSYFLWIALGFTAPDPYESMLTEDLLFTASNYREPYMNKWEVILFTSQVMQPWILLNVSSRLPSAPSTRLQVRSLNLIPTSRQFVAAIGCLMITTKYPLASTPTPLPSSAAISSGTSQTGLWSLMLTKLPHITI